MTSLKAQTSTRQIVFLLDEVDELLAFDAQSKAAGQLFRTFRAMSHQGFCRFVFSGSRTLYRHLHNPQSPFFNFCEDMVLKTLEEKSIAEIVSKPMHVIAAMVADELPCRGTIPEPGRCNFQLFSARKLLVRQ